ncbi:MAG TPA: efflux RND transporter periplasmic adaptor subunit [Chthoniobacteraceae bacterium]|nr:efflux RND transporter periplasmic adaptor subunit [Chthoniobacteraceae bacterium]
MKRLIPLFLFILATPVLASGDPRSPQMVVLDEIGVKNLRLKTAEVSETDFEETVFALGRIEAIPGRVASVSSRISGRVVELKATPGDQVRAEEEVVKVESRQPGDPPPVISLKTPIAGLVTRLETRLGDPVEPDRALLEVTDLTEVYAVARVPEHEAGKMKPGTMAHITVTALPEKTFNGELLRFGTSADRQSGTLDAVFRLVNPEGLLRAEMRAEFSIVLNRRANVLSVPRAALQGEAAERFVYVKDFDLPNAFIKTRVQVGEVNDRFVEILGGLFPADEVVTQGAYSLSFAGASTVSLKEALDAAHGHEHAEDGSELTPEKKAAMAAAKAAQGGPVETAREGRFWKYVSGGLFLALMASLFRRKHEALKDEAVPSIPATPKEGKE